MAGSDVPTVAFGTTDFDITVIGASVTATPATVVGHSWAGGVAVLMAVHHPDTVKSLVMVGAACTPDSLNALDRWLNVPGVGDVLTVAGLVGIIEVLPRMRRLTRFVADVPRSARRR